MVRQEPPKSLASPGPPAVSADDRSEALQSWLRTGFVLYRSCVGLDRFLAELSRDYHRMVLQQASSVRPDEQLACTCQVALYDPASSCDTCKRVADAIESSGGPPDQRPALTWSNSDPALWLDLRLGAWEVAKLYAGSMGPPFLARSTSPREADVGTKLTILRGLAKVTHALDPAVVAAVGEAHQRWLGKASREMSKAESAEVQQAMQGLIEAVHGVHEASQQYLIEALQATETISGSADLLRSYGPAVVEAVLTEPIKRIRVQRLEASGAAAAEAETAGLLERLTSASAGLGSVASAVVERVDRVLADRQQAAAKGSGAGGDKRPSSHLIGAEDDEDDDEEEDSEAIAQLEKKFHGGIRPEVQSTLASIRAAIEQRNSKEVLRLGLPLLLKAKDLLPVELHCTHEYLSWAYSAEKRMPQARAAIDKALQVPGIYCPLALRLKWRNLEIIEDSNESAEESRALMMESLETLDLIKEEDELPSDRSRRVAISVNLCFLLFQQLRQLSREEEGEETVTAMREICRESIERLTGTVEAFKQGQVRKEQQPFLWVSAQRLLGLFLTEASVKEPDSGGYLDRAIECYHEVIQTVIYHRFVRGLVNQETQQLATYRLELARIHLQRRRDEEDEQAALALFDACFETAQEAGEIINTLRYRAEFLNERGDKNHDEGDLRAAINDYQQALEVLQNHRELREKHQVEIAHFQRAMGLIYMGIVNMKLQQHEQSKEGGGEENGSGGAGADQEKAINHLLAAHDVFRKQDEGILDAGMTALQLGDLFRHRTRDRKKRNQERAIEWYTKANQMMREGTKGNSASRGLVEMLVRVADSLSKMYEERVNGDKADNAKHAMGWRIKAAELSSLLTHLGVREEGTGPFPSA